MALPKEKLIAALRDARPDALGIWAFGSQISGHGGPDSDLDLAILVPGYASRMELFALSNNLAEIAGREVDLVDLRAATTVMQYQIITGGALWWHEGSAARLYETFILSEKLELDRARAPLIADIQKRGRVYDR